METGKSFELIHLPLFLFPPVSWWVMALKSQKVVLVKNENWVKQSYRNRFEIYGPNNRQKISFPIRSEGKNGPISKVLLDHTHTWHRQNWRSVCTAYNKSPFFEFYKDELEPLFLKPYDLLMGLSMDALKLVENLLQTGIEFELKEVNYAAVPNNFCSRTFRETDPMPEEYQQVFAERYGFQSNLSVLDVLFNLGPEASGYLFRQASM